MLLACGSRCWIFLHFFFPLVNYYPNKLQCFLMLGLFSSPLIILIAPLWKNLRATWRYYLQHSLLPPLAVANPGNVKGNTTGSTFKVGLDLFVLLVDQSKGRSLSSLQGHHSRSYRPDSFPNTFCANKQMTWASSGFQGASKEFHRVIPVAFSVGSHIVSGWIECSLECIVISKQNSVPDFRSLEMVML